jgi:hypothetical protein
VRPGARLQCAGRGSDRHDLHPTAGSGTQTSGIGSGTTYYVSTLSGSNGNSGTSSTSPWYDFTNVNVHTFQPGDRILLERGSHWSATILSPLGSGSATSPIVIDSYGTGTARPRIDAAGYQSNLNGASQAVVNDPTYYPNFAYGSGAVTLFNQQYWEISDLELTNTASGTFDPTNKANNFSGVRVWARNAGTLNHIYVRANYIHDVTGEVSYSGDRAEGKRTGGIVVYTWDYNTDGQQTRFNDLRIENNFIANVSMEGICLQQASKTNLSFVNRTGYNDGSPWIPYTHLMVDGNLVNNYNDANSSDAIQLIGAQFANVYNNLVVGGGTVGIEADYTDQVTIDRNEVAGVTQHYVNGGGQDHAGIDGDVQSSNLVIERNYTHDNGEGIILDAFSFGYNDVIRYNLIANNDVGNEGSGATAIPGDQLRVAAETGNAFIYNNTIYDKGTTLPIMAFNSPTTSGDFPTYYIENNLFDGGKASWPGVSTFNPAYSNNSYYGNGAKPLGDVFARTSNPLLVSPGATDYGTTPGGLPYSAQGYRLSLSSPVRNAGRIPSLTAMQALIPPPARDLYFGSATDPMILGADAVAEGLPAVLTAPIAAAVYNSGPTTDSTGHTWTPDQTYAGWTGSVPEAALPISGTTAAPGAGTLLGYRVVFPEATTYYTWVRGVAPGAASSSLDLGIDGSYPASGQDVVFPVPSTSFQFTGQSASSGSPASAALTTTAGAHTVDVTMRQDGVRFDQLQLTTDPSYIPVIAATSYNPATSNVGSTPDSTGHTWTVDTTFAGFFNTAAMLAGPASTPASGTLTANAALHYSVNFPAPGNYYLWVRGYSNDGTTGSVALTIDGVAAQPVQLPVAGSYVWANSTVSSGGVYPVIVQVFTAGQHDLAMYMVDPGIRVDALFITSSSTATPQRN